MRNLGVRKRFVYDDHLLGKARLLLELVCALCVGHLSLPPVELSRGNIRGLSRRPPEGSASASKSRSKRARPRSAGVAAIHRATALAASPAGDAAASSRYPFCSIS